LINNVKPADVIRIARKIFQSNLMTVTTLGSTREDDFNNVDWSIL
jgi:hypothetical protein